MSTRGVHVKGEPEPLEKEIHKILGLKREDRFSKPFFELVKKTCQVIFRTCFGLVISVRAHGHCESSRRSVITSVDHKGVTCYGLRGRGVESRSLMTSVETRDLSGKTDRSRVNSNTKRVGKSRHVDGGMFTTVAILNEKSFDP